MFCVLPCLPGLEIPDAERRVLILRLRHRVAPVGRRRERVRDVHAEARDREQLLRRLGLGDVPHGIAAQSRAVELVLMRGRVVADVEVVIAAAADLLERRGIRHLADEPGALGSAPLTTFARS